MTAEIDELKQKVEMNNAVLIDVRLAIGELQSSIKNYELNNSRDHKFMKERIGDLVDKVNKDISEMKVISVTKTDFWPVKTVVFGLCALILMTVFTAIIKMAII